MASDLTVGLDMIAAATVPTKPAARLLWGVVTSTASPVQVVLENDASATSRPVSGNAAGPVAAGDRVLLARQRRRLTIVANSTAQGRVATMGWISLPALTGWTSAAEIRREGQMVRCRGQISYDAGSIPVSPVADVATIASAALRPAKTWVSTQAAAGSVTGKVAIEPDGRVRVISMSFATSAYIRLDLTWPLG